MIIFSSISFIFRFLPIFLVIYYLTPARLRNAVLTAGSLVFYAFGSLPGTALLAVLTVGNHLFGTAAWTRPGREPSSLQRGLGLAAILADLGVLAACKVLARVLGSAWLPVGLSFYIFKMLSFQLDIRAGRIVRKPDMLSTAAYLTMFPQITQGPIMRYADGGFDERLPRETSLRNFADGLFFFVLGLSMKVLLADRLAILWSELRRIGYASISTPLAWFGAYGYTFRLYYDFWGYSLMAAGIGTMLGFRFIVNFDHPYAAVGIADFYRRWHVTLGHWFRDYVYIPLGGSRNGTLRCIGSLLAVWTLTGLWHGGSLNFLIWGLLLGVLIILEKFVLRGLLQRVPLVGRLGVWILIPLTWVIFAFPDLGELQVYVGRLFPLFANGVAVNAGDMAKYGGMFWPYFAAAILFCVPDFYGFVVTRRTKLPVVLAALALFWLSIYRIVTSAANPFMYFSF